jgi:hypothetical protein
MARSGSREVWNYLPQRKQKQTLLCDRMELRCRLTTGCPAARWELGGRDAQWQGPLRQRAPRRAQKLPESIMMVPFFSRQQGRTW